MSAVAAVVAADRALADLHDGLRREGVSCAALAAAFMEALGADAPALAAVAAEADRSGRDNAFHNPAHSREVATNWWLLARLHGSAEPVLDGHAILLGLIAAFGHDLSHDGRGNVVGGDYVPFRLERVAADIVEGIMTDAGMAPECRAKVSAMILSTDVRHGYPHLSGGGADEHDFTPLAEAVVLLSARMLRDADLMPSAGTSIAAYRARTAELEREGGLPAGSLSGDAAAAFFDKVAERRFLSPAAQPFAGTLHMIATEATGC